MVYMLKLPEWVYRFAEKVLMESIGYPSIAGEYYGEIASYYRDVLREYGVSVTVHRVPDSFVRENLPKTANPDKPRYILIARIGAGEKKLQFNGHYDVVEPGKGWSVTEPFKARKVGDRIYGRGATDMKGGIACFLASIAYLSSTKEPLDHVVEAVLVPDEEIGGATGTGYLVRELGSRPDWVVIGEPSGLDTIWIGHKGLVWAIVSIEGRQSHASTPWKGVNAFEKMVLFVQEFLRRVEPLLKTRRSSYEYDEPEGAYPTIVLGGRVESVGSINVVPGRVSFSIDRRLIVEENTEDVIRELESLVKEVSRDTGVKASMEVVARLEPALTSIDSKLVSRLAGIVEDVVGVSPRKIVCVGGLDLHYYSEAGVSVVAYGPGEPGVAHKVDEYIGVDSMYRAIEVYTVLAREGFKG